MKWDQMPVSLKCSLTYLSKFSEKPPMDTLRIIKYYAPNVNWEERINDAVDILKIRERGSHFPKSTFNWVISYVKNPWPMPLFYQLYKIVEFFQKFLYLKAPPEVKKQISIDLYPYAAKFNWCNGPLWYYFTNPKRSFKGEERRVKVRKLLDDFCDFLLMLGAGESLKYFKEKFPQMPLYQRALDAEAALIKGETSA